MGVVRTFRTAGAGGAKAVAHKYDGKRVKVMALAVYREGKGGYGDEWVEREGRWYGKRWGRERETARLSEALEK